MALKLSQDVILKKLKKYLLLQRRDEVISDSGYCSGITALWLYFKRLDRSPELEHITEKISRWDESQSSITATLQEDFDFLINNIVFLQSPKEYVSEVEQRDLELAFPVLLGEDMPQVSKKEFQMTHVFNKLELMHTLSEVIKDDKMIRLGSGIHAAGLYKKGDEYIIFDPNSETGEQHFKTLSQVADELDNVFYKRIESPLKKHPHGKPLIPVSITIFDLAGSKPGDYPEALELIKAYLERRKAMKKGSINDLSRDGVSALQLAIRYNQIETVRLLLDEGASTETRNSDGIPALHFAISAGFDEILDLILQHRNSNINTTDSEQRTALHFVIENKKENIFKKLLTQKGIDFNARDKNGRTPLNYMIYFNWPLESIQQFISTYHPTIESNELGDTALHEAIHNPNIGFPDEVAKYLIQNFNTKLNIRNSRGETPMHKAVLANNVKILTWLIQNQADLNAEDIQGRTALHLAIQRNDFASFTLLLDAGADINIRDSLGKTPLHYAIEKQNTTMLKALFTKNANLVMADNEGQTPLHYLIKKKYPDNYIKPFVKRMSPSELSIADNDVKTALHYAIENKQTSIVQMLFEKKADFNVVDSIGRTILHYLVNNNCSVKVIKEYLGAMNNIEKEDLTHRSALHIAIFKNDLAVSKVLIEAFFQKGIELQPYLEFAQKRQNSGIIQLLEAKISEAKPQQDLDNNLKPGGRS